MKNVTKGRIIKGSALCIDVGVPLAATISRFPIWVEESAEASMSGLFLVFAFLSCLPFLKQIREYFKSPSAWVVWAILLAVFVALRNIIDQMVVVCFAGAVANVIGAFIYHIGTFVGDRPDKGGVKTDD
jgi:hypothetical protein